MSGHYLSCRLKISSEAVSKVMGQSGATIKKIQEESGAKLTFQSQNNETYRNGRVLIIKALEADKVELARQRVEELCGSSNIHLVEEEPVFLDLQSFANQPSSPDHSLNSEALGGSVCSEVLVVDRFPVPFPMVAFVVGRDQGNLKQLQTKLSLNTIQLQIPFIGSPGEKFCAIALSGPFEKVEEAKKILQKMVEKVKQRLPHLQLAPMSSVQTSPPAEKILKPQPAVEKAVRSEISAKQPEVQPIVKVLNNRTQAKIEEAYVKTTSVTPTIAMVKTRAAPESVTLSHSADASTRSLKRPLAPATEKNENGLKIKIHKKQLKVLEEQQIYFKKRTLLVEKQIEQLDMDNYVKRSQLHLPASLTIEYNGDTYKLSNQIDPQDKAEDEKGVKTKENEKKIP